MRPATEQRLPPVSYTHLDVYKRQGVKNIVDIGEQFIDVFTGDAKTSLLIFVEFAGASLHCGVLVSFGHDSSPHKHHPSNRGACHITFCLGILPGT